MDEIFEKRKNQAEQGRIYWNSLVEKFKIDANKYVLLVYTQDMEYVTFAMKYADDFLKTKGADSLLVLTDSSKICELAEDNVKGLEVSLLVNKQDMENLLALYCLYEFTDHLLIGGIEEVPGRTGSKLIGRNGISKEEFVKISLYNFV